MEAGTVPWLVEQGNNDLEMSRMRGFQKYQERQMAERDIRLQGLECWLKIGHGGVHPSRRSNIGFRL